MGGKTEGMGGSDLFDLFLEAEFFINTSMPLLEGVEARNASTSSIDFRILIILPFLSNTIK